MKPIARKIYDPSQHTLEKKMEFMASIIFIFFSIKCKKLDVYQQNMLFHQTNTRSKVFILHLNCFISFFIHYIWVILISNNPSLSIHFTTAFQRPYFNFTGQTYMVSISLSVGNITFYRICSAKKPHSPVRAILQVNNQNLPIFEWFLSKHWTRIPPALMHCDFLYKYKNFFFPGRQFRQFQALILQLAKP